MGAATYLYRAGAKAQAEARYAAANAHYAATIDALAAQGADADRALELDAHLELWSTRISTGQVEGMSELGQKVEALARALDDGPRLARVQVRQAQAIVFAAATPGTLHSAIERAREAVTHADASDLRTRSYACFIAAVACRDLGRLEESVAEFEVGTGLFATAAESGLEPGLIYPIYVSLCGWGAEALAQTGDKSAARGRADEALAAALELGARPEIGHCHMLLARLAEGSGHRVAARRIFDELGMTFWSARG